MVHDYVSIEEIVSFFLSYETFPTQKFEKSNGSR